MNVRRVSLGGSKLIDNAKYADTNNHDSASSSKGGNEDDGDADRETSTGSRESRAHFEADDQETVEERPSSTKRTWRSMSIFMPLPEVPKDEIINIISNVPTFQNLSTDDIDSLADCFQVRRFGPDEELIRVGQEVDDFHVIYGGECRVSVPQQIGTLKVGDCIGTEALSKRHLKSAVAVSSGMMDNLMTLSLSGTDLSRLGLKKKLMKRRQRRSKYIGRKGTNVHLEADTQASVEIEKTPEVRELIRNAGMSNTSLLDVLQLTSDLIDLIVDSVSAEAITAGM
jgi:hypothetical protein